MENQETSPDGKDQSLSSNGAPVRRRISRACDQCNQLRTKCDGKSPCAHCVEFGLTCEYARERKKRGKASKKEIAAQLAAEGAAAAHNNGGSSDIARPVHENGRADVLPKADGVAGGSQGTKRKRSTAGFVAPQLPAARLTGDTRQQPANGNGTVLPGLDATVYPNTMRVSHDVSRPGPSAIHMDQPTNMTLPTPQVSNTSGIPFPRTDYGSIDDYHRSILHPGHPAMAGHNILHNGAAAMPNPILQGGTITGYGDNSYSSSSPNTQTGISNATQFRLGESPLSAEFLGQSPPIANSPGWLSLPSPSASLYASLAQPPSTQTLRYPVLQPLLPHISAIIPLGLACDLLELYFASVYSTIVQPQSPYVLVSFFRKHSFLRQNNPRRCSPALLASMLWIAAQTSESAFLTSPPSARGRICQKLLELTVGLLKPLIHTTTNGGPNYSSNTVINGVALGGFGVIHNQVDEVPEGAPGASGGLDDIVTYIHLATVVSAGEYKAASIRWWNCAWTLARELKLGREVPLNGEHTDNPALGVANGKPGHEGPIDMSEERREERRRIWWLLYIIDRHLALCYNRPLFLLDIECEGLLQPDDDAAWQAGEFYPAENHGEAHYFRPRGPPFHCTGNGIFGFFLPLMTILGEIVYLNHARNHPRFGTRFRGGEEWDVFAQEISQHLEAYGRSLKDFQARNLPPPEGTSGAEGQHNGEPLHIDNRSPSSIGTSQSGTRVTEAMLRTKIVVAYGTHLMHTMHILINGKWDPISLLDDNDLWISTPTFVSATGHAVDAAEAINEILDHDPDLSLMTFFFGIYLLHGSFLLLLIADKLQADATPSVVRACEAIVRAHEACVVTLNTQYQRNFRRVMRSALAQVRGRSAEDSDEQRLRRREVLARYRWTGDGTGLAL